MKLFRRKEKVPVLDVGTLVEVAGMRYLVLGYTLSLDERGNSANLNLISEQTAITAYHRGFAP